ncbi:unnamed protein product [Calypogeia fissa]
MSRRWMQICKKNGYKGNLQWLKRTIRYKRDVCWKRNWKEEEFYYPPEYWTQTCGLPDGGIVPSQLSEEHITNDQLESVFGKKSGRNGFPITNSEEIAKDDIIKLTQVLDGHDYPVNGMLGIQLVRGFYWERIKGDKVNWAAFAADKHRGQIGKARRRKDSRPTGPPIVRIDRHYVSWAPIKPPSPPMFDYIPRPLTFLNSPLDGMSGKPDEESTLYGIKPTTSTYSAPDPTHTATALSHLIGSSLEVSGGVDATLPTGRQENGV